MRIVLFLIAAALYGAPPTPESHFGHKMGADRVLLDWEKVVSYFRALEKTSDRIRVGEIGKTVQGRPMIAAYISNESTIKNIAAYQQIQKKLADSRKTDEATAEKLIAEGKTVVMITCSIHSTEVASTSTAVEFAHRILTEEKAKYKTILDNVIFILVPSLNPDGVDIVTRWYRKTLGTPYEGTSPPELYHAYVGHDNNRDWYILSQPETRAVVSRLHNVWHPHIVYDVHQQGAYASRIFVPPWMDPIDPNVDRTLAQSMNMIGMGMAADLTAAGKKGVAVNAMYDFWTPARHYQAYHGGMRILTESASARLASPITVTADDISTSALGYNPREAAWNYLDPWIGGEWKVGDIVDYQLTAWESLLWQAATRREDMLRNFYRILRTAATRTSPYAFVLPRDQFDPGASKKLLQTLAAGLVEVEQATDNFTADGKTYSAGAFVIRMQQPFSAYAKTLLERQKYPDLRLYPGGPPKRPYDVTAQTLPLLMGVDVVTVKDKFQAALTPATMHSFQYNGKLPEGALPASDVDAWRQVNAAWNAAKPVARDAAGNFYVNLPAIGDRKPLRKPRIALYQSYAPSMDEGWTRWILENFGFQYTRLKNPDLLSGSLRKRFDVIVFPDQRATAIHTGLSRRAMPEEYQGGLGDKGAELLKQFANEGGTLVFLNDSSEYAAEHLGIAVKNSVKGVGNREFYSPGSMLNVSLDTSHALARGMPKEITIWSEGSPAWELADGAPQKAVARYPASNVLASGWLLGEKYLTGRAALLDVPMGQGHVVMFGMRPQYRAQSYQNFKMLFNALAGF
ncbi:MAG: peptidase M14 [Candidatus Solibacter usitatus]|nr:peptidase M14 [Candidatus Solibacter usitatus]